MSELHKRYNPLTGDEKLAKQARTLNAARRALLLKVLRSVDEMQSEDRVLVGHILALPDAVFETTCVDLFAFDREMAILRTVPAFRDHDDNR